MCDKCCSLSFSCPSRGRACLRANEGVRSPVESSARLVRSAKEPAREKSPPGVNRCHRSLEDSGRNGSGVIFVSVDFYSCAGLEI